MLHNPPPTCKALVNLKLLLLSVESSISHFFALAELKWLRNVIDTARHWRISLLTFVPMLILISRFRTLAAARSRSCPRWMNCLTLFCDRSQLCCCCWLRRHAVDSPTSRARDESMTLLQREISLLTTHNWPGRWQRRICNVRYKAIVLRDRRAWCDRRCVCWSDWSHSWAPVCARFCHSVLRSLFHFMELFYKLPQLRFARKAQA